jgi:cell wall-associated NlpC family hydrolase
VTTEQEYADQLVAFAKAQLGKPYVWGGTGPNVWDCSGLTMMAAASIGVWLAHASSEQFVAYPRIADALRPGDFPFFHGGEEFPPRPGHVGIYVGDDTMISAFDEQMGVCCTKFSPIVDQESTEPMAYWGAIRPALYGRSLPHPSEPTLFLTEPLMTGPSVVLCQNRLVAYGFQSILAYPGCKSGVDGIFGDRTRLAVEYFQMKEELVCDGIVGALTWGALLKKPTT